MTYLLSEEQRAVKATFAAFVDKEVRPVAAQLDREPRFPQELFERVGQLGFFGMRYATEEAEKAGAISYLLAVEELARGSLAVAAACTMQSLMGTYFVSRFGDTELKERLFYPALEGKVIGAICMTEPNAGSDLLSMKSRAEERAGQWRVSGQKTWVTSAPVADMFTVFAKTGEKELSIFLVEKGAEGLQIGRNIDKMGVRASLTSEVAFEEAPATLLGERGAGLEGLLEVLVEIRVMTAALAIGVAQAAFEEALAYSKERSQFGKPICKYQAVQAHLAEMATDLQAARALTHSVALRAEAGENVATEAAMAKLFSSEAALGVCDRAARVLASYGFAKDYAVERYLRDVRFTLIGGGTSEILRNNIGRALTQ